MTQCTSPIEGWKSIDGGITQSKAKAYGDVPLTVRCGQCMGCRLERAIRSVHEASLYDNNIFATLTYSDENLPYGESLNRRHVQLFIKRLRKKVPHCRFFYCGEYGEETHRPHYHALLFNYRPNDAELISRRGGNEYYRSNKLDDLWSLGHCNFSDVTFTSAAYVAGYVTKKQTGKNAEPRQWIDENTGQIIDQTPEFQGQSLRPGIGSEWIKTHLKDVYSKDQIIIEGRATRPPRYYDEILKKTDLDLFRKVRLNRLKEDKKKKLAEPYHGTGRQMFAKNKITLSKQTKRELK